MHGNATIAATKTSALKIRLPDGKDECRDRILACRNCELWSATRGPVPFRGPVPARVCVVGEAPGRDEDAKGGPFLGPAGKLLASTFALNKVRPERLFYCNLVSCYPKLEKPTPTKEHIRACHGNVWDQIEYSQADWILLVGGLALDNLFPWQFTHDRKKHKTITVMRGKGWHYKGKNWMACVHPAAALRSRDKYLPMLEQDIRAFVKMVKQGYIDPMEECYECGKEPDEYSPEGIGWCKRHVR